MVPLVIIVEVDDKRVEDVSEGGEYVCGGGGELCTVVWLHCRPAARRRHVHHKTLLKLLLLLLLLLLRLLNCIWRCVVVMVVMVVVVVMVVGVVG